VRDALLVMTRAKAGSVAVVDARGRLAGVFTDGDLRRHLSAGDDVMNARLAAVMTRSPVTVKADALAADALKIFHDRNIDDLIVVDARRRPVGLVDLQDLPKLKLM
jgi:arabinose-5-phosphate isomerase